MVLYVQKIINIINSRIAGMKANPQKWANQEVTALELEEEVTALSTQSAKMDTAENALQNEQAVTRSMVDALAAKQKKVDNLAIGLHSEEPLKLSNYGIPLRKTNTVKPVPSKVMVTTITDDEDGDGFVITWQKVAGAVRYEIERGVSTNTGDLSVIPPFALFKSTSTISVKDEDIQKGIRYFYRVRALNAAGAGEWSAPVHRVQ